MGNNDWLKRRVARKCLRGKVLRSTDDHALQNLQVSFGPNDTWNNIERIQNYGLTSRPQDGAQCVAVMFNEDHGLVVAVDDRRFRLKSLGKGEVALYTDEGDKVHLKRDRIIEVVAGTKVILNTPLVEATNDMVINKTLTVKDNVTMEKSATIAVDALIGGISSVGHKHPENDSGGPTDPPLPSS